MALEMETASENKDTTNAAPTSEVVGPTETLPTKPNHSALDTTSRKIVVHNVLKFMNNKELDAIGV